MQVAGKSIVAYAINDAKVHRLSLAAHISRDFCQGHSENFRRRAGMNILPFPESLQKTLVPGHVGQDPQLNLGVVCR